MALLGILVGLPHGQGLPHILGALFLRSEDLWVLLLPSELFVLHAPTALPPFKDQLSLGSEVYSSATIPFGFAWFFSS